jgi:hypothetical protein
MDANDLRQKDLVPIFGSESIVSEVLHKKRDLNKAHIKKLSKRFHVSPAVFPNVAALPSVEGLTLRAVPSVFPRATLSSVKLFWKLGDRRDRL